MTLFSGFANSLKIVVKEAEGSKEVGAVLALGFLIVLAMFSFVAWLALLLFQYSLWSILKLDAPWYADLIGGVVLGPLNVPIAIICWVLRIAGLEVPFLHS